MNGTVLVVVRLDQAMSVPSGSGVDGTIELERLPEVVYVGRPVFGSPNSEAVLFRIDPDNTHATKVRVRFGRSSLNTIEVLKGLKVEDRVLCRT